MAALLTFAGYWIATEQWYLGKRDFWKECWLPMLVNVFSTAFVFLLVYLFPETKTESEDSLADRVADRVLSKLPPQPPPGMPYDQVMKFMGVIQKSDEKVVAQPESNLNEVEATYEEPNLASKEKATKPPSKKKP